MNTYVIEFSVYGGNPTPAWRKAIVSRQQVQAESPADALLAAGFADDPEAVRSIQLATA